MQDRHVAGDRQRLIDSHFQPFGFHSLEDATGSTNQTILHITSRKYCTLYPGKRINYARPVMARPNYSFEKRQRELAKKKKKEEKRQRKAAAQSSQSDDTPPQPDVEQR